jgi:hypothetical protein
MSGTHAPTVIGSMLFSSISGERFIHLGQERFESGAHELRSDTVQVSEQFVAMFALHNRGETSASLGEKRGPGEWLIARVSLKRRRMEHHPLRVSRAYGRRSRLRPAASNATRCHRARTFHDDGRAGAASS